MLVKEISEQHIQDIGHAFGYYDYGEEKGMASWFRDKEAVVTYICGFVRCVLTDGFLHTTSERGEGYIAYKLPGQKVSFKAARILLRGMLQSMSLGELFHFARMLSKAGLSLEDVLNKEKKPASMWAWSACGKLIRAGLYAQGHGSSFAEGDRLGIPVVLDTDAKSKCDKYVHLGMKLYGTRDLGPGGTLYDLVRYPKKAE